MIPDRVETVPRTSPRVILLVEDEADARTILSRRLQAFGWNCLAHASVESALHDPDLRYVAAVVVDLARLVNRALSRARLTKKEEEVARLVLKGLTSAEIGAMMGNSEKTIKQHLTQVYAKLGVAGRAEFFHLVFPS